MVENSSKPQPLERLTIWPHRSLSPKGFTIVIGLLAGLLFTIGLGFFLAGAWPVIGFLGLELLIVWGAFKLNYRAAKVRETIETTTETLKVEHRDEHGNAAVSEFPVGWLRVQLSPPTAPAPSARYRQRVILSSHGVETEIGAFLHPIEKAKLRHEIDGMVARSRSARDRAAQG
ncbi:MAG: DUF2244 domain-containing protein [Candidatus Puniceispirillaceae bacterium]